jgi:hypothetical protein
MHAPYIEEYTSHLSGAPPRSHWPLVPLVGVGMTAMIAAGAMMFIIVGIIF